MSEIHFLGSKLPIKETAETAPVVIRSVVDFFKRRAIRRTKKFLVFGHKSVGKDTFMRRLLNLPIDAYQPPTSKPSNPLQIRFQVNQDMQVNAKNYYNLPGETLDIWEEIFIKVKPQGIIFIIDEPRDMLEDIDDNNRLVYLPSDGREYRIVETKEARIESTRKALHYVTNLLTKPQKRTFLGNILPFYTPVKSHLKCVLILVNRWDKRESWQETNFQRESFLFPYRDLFDNLEQISVQNPQIKYLFHRLNLFVDDKQDFSHVLLNFAFGILGKTKV